MNKIQIAEKLVERCRHHGAEEAEAYVLDSHSVDIDVSNSVAEKVTVKDRKGYGLRVLIDGRMGFASSNNIDLSDSEDIIKRLITNTRHHSADEHNIFPEPVDGAMDDRSLEQYDLSLRDLPMEKRIETALAIDQETRAIDPRIVQIGWLVYGDAADEYAIVSSKGVSGTARQSEVFGFVMAVAMEQGADGHPDPSTAQTGNGIDVATHFHRFSPGKAAEKAARAALRMLGATDGKTSEVPAVLPPETGYSFLELIAAMVSADLVQKKKSLFTGKLNEPVASELVTIIDDGRLKGGLASAAVDAEGVPTTTREIISGGVLKDLLYDSYTAHRGKTTPTGNASRASYSTRPMIAPNNFYMKPGQLSRDQIMARVDHGIFITEVSGLHASVDPVTGHFSIPSKGIMIEHGELTVPVSNITVSGNIFDLFKGIDAVGDDLTWEVHGNFIGVPTFRVGSVKLGGK